MKIELSISDFILFGWPHSPLDELEEKDGDPGNANDRGYLPQKLLIDFGSIQIVSKEDQAGPVDSQCDQNGAKDVPVHMVDCCDYI